MNSRTIRSRSAGVASRGTRSLSCRLTPYAPSSPSFSTMSLGEIGGAHRIAERIAAGVADGPEAEGEVVLGAGV